MVAGTDDAVTITVEEGAPAEGLGRGVGGSEDDIDGGNCGVLVDAAMGKWAIVLSWIILPWPPCMSIQRLLFTLFYFVTLSTLLPTLFRDFCSKRCGREKMNQ
jgi:hypothetical protein